VILPKVTITGQVTTHVRFFEIIEKKNNLVAGTLKMETMVEATQIIMDEEGKNPLMKIVTAGEGRLIAAHFGVTVKYQTTVHSVCEFAHHITKVALGSTSVFLSDGATNRFAQGWNLNLAQIPMKYAATDNLF
jgi:hypothetical protein